MRLCEARAGFVWSSVLNCAAGAAVIVLLDPTTNRLPGLFHRAVPSQPDLFLLQAAVEAFDQAIAFRMVERGAAVRDAEPRERLQEAG